MKRILLIALLVLPFAMHAQTHFGVSATSGCAPLEVTVSNNHPSNGYQANPWSNLAGCTYEWNSGDGQVFTDENPGTITYATSGSYYLTYDAEIDTSGFVLTEVLITSVDCSDPNIFGTGDPDVYFQLIDANGNVVYTSGHTSNMNPPISFTGLSLPLNLAPYSIGVFDSDNDTDDNCIDDSETGIPVGINLPDVSDPGPTTQIATAGALTFSYTIEKHVDYYSDSVLIEVYDSPNIADLLVYDFADSVICVPTENSVSLSLPSIPDTDYEWLMDGQSVQNGGNQLDATSNGTFQVVATNSVTGCSDSSNLLIVYEDNLQSNFGTNGLENQSGTLHCNFSGAISYTWYVNGIYIDQNTLVDHQPLAPGGYYVVIETAMGCLDTSNVVQFGNAALEDLVDLPLQVYPNPTSDILTISTTVDLATKDFYCLSIEGKVCAKRGLTKIAPSEYQLDVSQLPAGVYFLKFGENGKRWVRFEIIR